MSSHDDNHSLIVNYLLGRLSETQLDRFERSYLTNEHLFEELQEVEDELIDDYASGALTTEQQVSFEKYFLRSPERREKVAFATALTERAVAWQKETQVFTETSDLNPESAKHSPSKLDALRWKRPVPAWRQWVAIAAAILLAIGVGILWLRNRELRRQLIAAETDAAKLRDEAATQLARNAETNAELSAEQRQTRMLEDQVEQLQSIPPRDAKDVVVSVILDIEYLVRVTRGEVKKKVRTLNVPADAHLVRLGLDFDKVPFEDFRVMVRRPDQSIVWRRAGLKARAIGEKRRIFLAIPAERLAPGDYEVLVSGVPSEGDPELVGRYYLKVERKE